MPFKKHVAGSRKYVCDECRNTFMAKHVHYRSFTATNRLKCPGCGSLMVTAYSRQAKVDIATQIGNTGAMVIEDPLRASVKKARPPGRFRRHV